MRKIKIILTIVLSMVFSVNTFSQTSDFLSSFIAGLDPDIKKALYEWNDGAFLSWDYLLGTNLKLMRYGLYQNQKEVNSFEAPKGESFMYGTFSVDSENFTTFLLHANGIEGDEIYTANLSDDRKNRLLLQDLKNENNQRVWIEILMFRLEKGTV